MPPWPIWRISLPLMRFFWAYRSSRMALPPLSRNLQFSDGASFGAAQPEQSVGLVDHLPIVLHAGVVFGPHVAIGVRQGQPSKDEVSHRNIGGAIGIDFAFDADQLAQARRHDLFRLLRPRPQIELARMGVEHPCAGVVQNIQNVLHPC